MAAAEPMIESTPAPVAVPAAQPSAFDAMKAAVTPAPVNATPVADAMPDWAKGMSSDDVAYIQNKGWHKEGKGPADILRSYQNLERLRGVGAEKLVKVPDWNNAEDVAAFNAKMGVPAEAAGYQMPELQVGAELVSPEDLGALSLALGHTPQQHAKAAEWIAQYFAQTVQAHQSQVQAEQSAEMVAWRKECGLNYEAISQAAVNAVTQLGFGAEDLDRLEKAGGKALVERIFSKVGAAIAEKPSPPKNDAGGFGPMTRETAAARLVELNGTAGYMERLKGDPALRRERENLQRIAFEG